MARLFLLGMVLVLVAGCGKRSSVSEKEVSAPTNEEPAAVVAEPDVTAVLEQLTQAVRKYSAEKQQVPSSLDALAAAGYLQSVPQAPPGKAFVIDTRNVRVVLK